jgi:hypothetical protein
MRDVSARLEQLAKRLPEDASDDLRFVARLLRTEADSLTGHAATGDMAATGGAINLAKMGLVGLIAVTSTFGTAIIDEAGKSVYDELVGTQSTIENQLSDIQTQVLQIGTAQITGATDSLIHELRDFAAEFNTTAGQPVFANVATDVPRNLKDMPESVKVASIQEDLDQMRDWLSDAEPSDPRYLPGSIERVSELVLSAEIQLQRVSAMRQLLAEEQSVGLKAGLDAPLRTSGVGENLPSKPMTIDADGNMTPTEDPDAPGSGVPIERRVDLTSGVASGLDVGTTRSSAAQDESRTDDDLS